MLLYLLVVILLAACSSEGVPLPNNGSVAGSLLVLAKKCPDQLLRKVINSQLNACPAVAPIDSELHFQCLMFYDINIQLCNAVGSLKLPPSLENDFKAAMGKTLDVKELCEKPIATRITDIPDHPEFKPLAQKILSNVISCAKVCDVPDISSQDSNFFCKYFSWGMGMLELSKTPPSASGNGDNGAFHEATHSNKPPTSQPAVNNQNQAPSQGISDKPSLLESSPLPEHSLKPDNIQPDNSHKPVSMPLPETHDNTGPTANENRTTEIIKPNLEPEGISGSSNSNNGASQAGTGKPTPNNAGAKPPLQREPDGSAPAADSPPSKPIPKEQGAGNVGAPGHSAADQEDADKTEDYGDTEAEDQGLANDPDQSQPPVDQNNSPRRNNAPLSANTGDREIFPPDGFTEDDDHFFPMFLSGIVLVVLLYVLYHNKSKVTKVVLGLLVEGRQSGRRRNSRGHAYRRLDTLEQAMSTQSSAAPSKIIY